MKRWYINRSAVKGSDERQPPSRHSRTSTCLWALPPVFSLVEKDLSLASNLNSPALFPSSWLLLFLLLFLFWGLLGSLKTESWHCSSTCSVSAKPKTLGEKGLKGRDWGNLTPLPTNARSYINCAHVGASSISCMGTERHLCTPKCIHRCVHTHEAHRNSHIGTRTQKLTHLQIPHLWRRQTLALPLWVVTEPLNSHTGCML